MSARRCTVEGCDSPYKARGLCHAHYQRLQRYGHELASGPGRLTAPPHSSPAECDRWVRGTANGCAHFSPEHWRAMAAAGQLPEQALAGGWHL